MLALFCTLSTFLRWETYNQALKAAILVLMEPNKATVSSHRPALVPHLNQAAPSQDRVPQAVPLAATLNLEAPSLVNNSKAATSRTLVLAMVPPDIKC